MILQLAAVRVILAGPPEHTAVSLDLSRLHHSQIGNLEVKKADSAVAPI